jgi:hypothetical protein
MSTGRRDERAWQAGRVLTIRCTQRLLTRLATRPEPAPPPSTTKLGDWYANLLDTPGGQIILCTSERTFLSVLVTAKDARRLLPAKLSLALGAQLAQLGVPFAVIGDELAAMEPPTYAKTASRSVLGVMNDFAVTVSYCASNGVDEAEMNALLARTPCGPIGMRFPGEVAKALLVGGGAN